MPWADGRLSLLTPNVHPPRQERLDTRREAVFEPSYVRHVIESVNDLDNVLYEISNENHPASTAWQYEMIRFIHDYEKTLPKQHPAVTALASHVPGHLELFRGLFDLFLRCKPGRHFTQAFQERNKHTFAEWLRHFDVFE